ncbi:MAG: hypothetical protein WCC52_02900 [Nitrosotalea sp.]
MSDLNRWAEKLTEEVYEKWRSKYPSKEGFKVFYGPVKTCPKLLIISHNPGGNAKNFYKENLSDYEKRNFSLPLENEYVTKDYILARNLKKFFASDMTLLEGSVAFPILFFRSKDVKSWKKKHKGRDRREMENFCYVKVKDILKKIKPKIILVIGFRTYHKLKKEKILDIVQEKPHKMDRLYAYSARSGNAAIFCTMHLSGARLSTKEFENSRKLFFGIVNNH